MKVPLLVRTRCTSHFELNNSQCLAKALDYLWTETFVCAIFTSELTSKI